MTLQKNKKILILIFVVIGIGLTGIFISENSCGVKHMMILNDMKTYEETLDPEFCEDILEKIDSFNEQCKPEIEILDCG